MELVRRFLPLLRPESIYLADQDLVGKPYDNVGFYPIVATLTYDITYAIAYDIVGQTYDIRYRMRLHKKPTIS